MGKRGQNEGSIRQKRKGLWEARYSAGFNQEGKQIQKSIYGKTRQEVKDKLIKILDEINTGNYIEPSKRSLNEVLDSWLSQLQNSGRIKPTTYGTYEQMVRVHIKPSIGNIPLRDLSADRLQKFYNEKLQNGRDDDMGGLSTATVIKIHNILHQCFDYAFKRKMVAYNPTLDVKPPKLVEKQIRILSKEEQARFQDVLAKERLKPLFLLDLATGLRLGELLALTWDDLNIEERCVRVTKTLVRIREKDVDGVRKTRLIVQTPKTKKSNRIVPLLDAMIPILQEYKEKQDSEIAKAGGLYSNANIVFCTEHGKYLEPRNIMRTFYRLIEKADIPHTNFHALRHTFASRMLEAGERERVLQEFLGHSTPFQTSKYIHVLEDTKRISINKINTLFVEDSKNNKDDEPDI